MPKKRRDNPIGVACATVKDLYDIGLVDDATMSRFDQEAKRLERLRGDVEPRDNWRRN